MRKPLTTGTRLVREWNGRTITVEVSDGGFVHAGRSRRSTPAATNGKCAGEPKLPNSRLMDVGELRCAPRNARTHSPRQLRQIAESIRAFGFTNRVLVDGDGHLPELLEAGRSVFDDWLSVCTT